MKKLFYILIFTSTFFLACGQGIFLKGRHGSVKRQKKTVNQSCVSYEGQSSVYSGQNSLMDEPKSVSEKNFQKYILSNHPDAFPKTTIRLCIVFQPNLAPCCRQTNIKDSLKMDAKQIDFLIDLVLKYPAFSKVQFNKDEKIKYLVIYMGKYRRNELSVGFAY